MVRIIIAIFLSCILISCKEALKIDPFPGVEIEEVICFDNASGDILWKCPRHEIRGYAFPFASSTIGLGHFLGGDKAIIFFEYNSSKNLLTGSIARNITCECYKDLPLKGKVLKRFNAFKRLSAESLFSLCFTPCEPRLDFHFQRHFYFSRLFHNLFNYLFWLFNLIFFNFK